MEQYLFLGFIGISILMSVLMAKGVSLFKAPMVLGYILAGAVIGQTVYLLNIKIQYDTFD